MSSRLQRVGDRLDAITSLELARRHSLPEKAGDLIRQYAAPATAVMMFAAGIVMTAKGFSHMVGGEMDLLRESPMALGAYRASLPSGMDAVAQAVLGKHPGFGENDLARGAMAILGAGGVYLTRIMEHLDGRLLNVVQGVERAIEKIGPRKMAAALLIAAGLGAAMHEARADHSVQAPLANSQAEQPSAAFPVSALQSRYANSPKAIEVAARMLVGPLSVHGPGNIHLVSRTQKDGLQQVFASVRDTKGGLLPDTREIQLYRDVPKSEVAQILRDTEKTLAAVADKWNRNHADAQPKTIRFGIVAEGARPVRQNGPSMGR